jgi:hypothetical protein
VLVDGLQALVRELVCAGELLGHGGLCEAVGEGEAAFESQGLGDLEVGGGAHFDGRGGVDEEKELSE